MCLSGGGGSDARVERNAGYFVVMYEAIQRLLLALLKRLITARRLSFVRCIYSAK